MGIVNWLMHRNMKKHASDMVVWATKSYKSVRAAEPAISDKDAFRKMLDGRVKFPGGDAARELILDRYGSSINGLCYYLGLNSQLMKGIMVFRCRQYIEYVDAELKKRGFDTPSDAVKRGYFKTLGL